MLRTTIPKRLSWCQMNEFFVYGLIDPRTGHPFYIGKGKVNRPDDHLSGRADGQNLHKDRKIASIRKAGFEPLVHIFFKHLIESEAYRLEEILILGAGRTNIEDHGVLTNVTLGRRPPNRKGKKLSPEQKARINQTRPPPWNQGLTKATHASIARVAELNSRRYSGRVAWNRGCNKLTKQEVALVKSDSRLQREIAADWGLSQSYISAIKRGKVKGRGE